MKKHILILIPLGLVAILYLPFLHNVFISDDISGIVEVAPRWTWLSAIGWPRVVHLGVLLQFWAYKLFGLVPWPFRLTNILFHMGNVVLVWFVVRKLSKPTIALIASLLFAIHPLAIESITWISGGVYAHYTFFFLLSFWLFTKKLSIINYQLSIFSFLLSLLISEKAVPLVFIFILYEWVYGNTKKNWKRLILYCIVSICFILFYISRVGIRMENLESANYQPVVGMFNPLLQIPIAISSYLTLFVFPVHLTLYHSNLRMGWWEFGIRAVFVLGYIGMMLWGLWKRKSFGFWLSWAVVGLGVTLLPLKIGWIVAERYVYVGLIGWCVLLAMIFDWVLSNKRRYVLGMCFGIVVLMLLSTQTIVRNTQWRSAETLWSVTLRESPTDPHSWNNMGDVYSKRGEYEKSIEAFTQATKINPNYADAYHNIGNTYLYMKKYDEAVPFFEKALSINPNLWQSYQDLAFIAAALKDYQKASAYFEKALTINSSDAVLWTNLGVVYLEMGDTDKVREAVSQALAIDPSDLQARKLQKSLQK